MCGGWPKPATRAGDAPNRAIHISIAPSPPLTPSKVPFYKPVERFRPHEETTNARRDRRSGPARCKLVRTGADGMEVELIWDGEYPGKNKELDGLDQLRTANRP